MHQKIFIILEKSHGMFCKIKFNRKFAARKENNPAEIAQLVEHNLAKVRVASSSLVFRSKETSLFV